MDISRSFLATAVSAALLASLLVPAAPSQAAGPIDDAGCYLAGVGSSADPYLVEQDNDFSNLPPCLSGKTHAYVSQTANIHIGGHVAYEPINASAPDGSATVSLTYLGNGHTLRFGVLDMIDPLGDAGIGGSYGLFGNITGALNMSNLNVVADAGAGILGDSKANVGILVGQVGFLNLNNVHVSAAGVHGGNNTGALAGRANSASLINTTAVVSAIVGSNHVGGLIGRLHQPTTDNIGEIQGINSMIQNSRFYGGVYFKDSGSIEIGGLVGAFVTEQDGTSNLSIRDSFFSGTIAPIGTVTGGQSVGGLVGRALGESGIEVDRSGVSATSSSKGIMGQQVGGLIGQLSGLSFMLANQVSVRANITLQASSLTSAGLVGAMTPGAVRSIRDVTVDIDWRGANNYDEGSLQYVLAPARIVEDNVSGIFYSSRTLGTPLEPAPFYVNQLVNLVDDNNDFAVLAQRYPQAASNNVVLTGSFGTPNTPGSLWQNCDVAGDTPQTDPLPPTLKLIPDSRCFLPVMSGYTPPVVIRQGQSVGFGQQPGQLPANALRTLGYYTISPALPVGLELNTVTGEIHGVPLEVSESTEYTVTAWFDPQNFENSQTKFFLEIFSGVVQLGYSVPGDSGAIDPSQGFGEVTAVGPVGLILGADGSFILKSWNTRADGTGRTVLPGEQFYLFKDTTLFALTNFEVRFDANGGTGFMHPLAISGALVLPPADGIARKGYTFTGWSKTESGELIEAFETLVISGNQTLYAQWRLWSEGDPGIFLKERVTKGEAVYKGDQDYTLFNNPEMLLLDGWLYHVGLGEQALTPSPGIYRTQLTTGIQQLVFETGLGSFFNGGFVVEASWMVSSGGLIYFAAAKPFFDPLGIEPEPLIYYLNPATFNPDKSSAGFDTQAQPVTLLAGAENASVTLIADDSSRPLVLDGSVVVSVRTVIGEVSEFNIVKIAGAVATPLLTPKLSDYFWFDQTGCFSVDDAEADDPCADVIPETLDGLWVELVASPADTAVFYALIAGTCSAGLTGQSLPCTWPKLHKLNLNPTPGSPAQPEPRLINNLLAYPYSFAGNSIGVLAAGDSYVLVVGTVATYLEYSPTRLRGYDLDLADYKRVALLTEQDGVLKPVFDDIVITNVGAAGSLISRLDESGYPGSIRTASRLDPATMQSAPDQIAFYALVPGVDNPVFHLPTFEESTEAFGDEILAHFPFRSAGMAFVIGRIGTRGDSPTGLFVSNQDKFELVLQDEIFGYQLMLSADAFYMKSEDAASGTSDIWRITKQVDLATSGADQGSDQGSGNQPTSTGQPSAGGPTGLEPTDPEALTKPLTTRIKRLSESAAHVSITNPVAAGKVQIMLNGREVGWVRAVDATDPRLRKLNAGPMAGSSYFVRTVTLQAGRKNVVEIYVDGQRVRRVAYGR